MNETSNWQDASDVDKLTAAVLAIKNETGLLPSERALADQLSVKRHQLRLALCKLRKSGQIEETKPKGATRPSKSFVEGLVRITNPLDVLELRLLIEPGLARLATLRASVDEASRIQSAAITPKNEDSGNVDLKFHRAIAAGAHNNLADEIYNLLRRVGVDARVRVASKVMRDTPESIRIRDAEHRTIADAISGRAPRAAEEAMRNHLESVRNKIIQRIESELG